MTTLRKLPMQAPSRKATTGKNQGKACDTSESGANITSRTLATKRPKRHRNLLGPPVRLEGYCPAAAAARLITATVDAAATPVQISSDFAPWCASIARPLACGRPSAAAAPSSAVNGGL